MQLNDKTPIVAIATAAGRGAIGVVRLSVPVHHTDAMLSTLFPGILLEPRHAHLLDVTDVKGALLDRAIVLYFSGLLCDPFLKNLPLSAFASQNPVNLPNARFLMGASIWHRLKQSAD